jgi:hypothetical protein
MQDAFTHPENPMTANSPKRNAAIRVPTPADLTALASWEGPCVSLIVPDHHPGAPDGSQQVRLKGLVKTALDRGLGLEELETAADTFARTVLGSGGGPGFAYYWAPGRETAFLLSGAHSQAVVASHPYILPLLTPAFSAHNLMVLGLSKKHVRLFEYVDGECLAAALPEGVPRNLDEAGRFHLRGVLALSKTGAGVRFGISGEREAARSSFEHFCALIDRGLAPLLDHRPLLLMGVAEEIAAFRRVSHCDSLMHAEVDGNVDTLTPAQIAAHAQRAAREEYERLGRAVLAEFREMRDRQRAISNPQEVLAAAAAGRVHQLVVRAGTEIPGRLHPDMDRAALPSEDLVNASAVETLRKGGMVFLLPQDELPLEEALCAILRY